MLPVVFSDKVISDFDFTDEVVDDMVIQKQSQIYQMSVLNLIFPKLILCVVLVSSEIKAYLVQPLFLVPECYFAQNVGHQDHSLSTYAKFSEKLTSFTPRYTRFCACQGLRNDPHWGFHRFQHFFRTCDYLFELIFVS